MSAVEIALPRRTGDLEIDVQRAVVRRDGHEVPLPKLSYDLLLALVDRAPAIVSIDELMAIVWPRLVVSPETVSQRVKLLRDALGDDPRQPRYVLGVRGRGYRWLPPIESLSISPPPAAVPPAVAEPAVPAAAPPVVPAEAQRPVWRRRAWLFVAALVIVAVAWLATRGREVPEARTAVTPPPASPAEVRSVAVLPFENLGGSPDDATFALGVADAVLHRLANVAALRVTARASSFALQHEQLDARDIGRKLNARYLLSGTVQSHEDQLRVTASLVDSSNGAQLWSLRFDRQRADIFAIEDEIAERVTSALQVSLDAGAAARAAAAGTRSFDAYLAYLQGAALIDSAKVVELRTAVERLSRAIAIDPRFAEAYVALSQAELARAEYEIDGARDQRFAAALKRSLELVDRALEIDPESGSAYVARAHLRAYSDLAGAEADYRRGLELSPNSAAGYAGLAAVLFEHPTRFPEALPLIEKARQIDPLQGGYDVAKAVYLLYGRSDVAGADRVLTSLLEREPLYAPAMSKLAELRWCCEARFADSIRYGEDVLRADPMADWTRRQLLRAYLDVGDVAGARRTIAAAPGHAPALRVPLLLRERNWPAAAEAAYEAVKAGTVTPIDNGLVVAAIRLDARQPGNAERASLTLGVLSGVTWDEQGKPQLAEHYSLLESEVGLADVLIASGQREIGRRLLEAAQARMDRDARELGRGEMWFWPHRSIVLTLLGRKQEAVAQLEKAMQHGQGVHDAWFYLELDPVLSTLRGDSRFDALRKQAAARAVAERALADRQQGAAR